MSCTRKTPLQWLDDAKLKLKIAKKDILAVEKIIDDIPDLDKMSVEVLGEIGRDIDHAVHLVTSLSERDEFKE